VAGAQAQEAGAPPVPAMGIPGATTNAPPPRRSLPANMFAPTAAGEAKRLAPEQRFERRFLQDVASSLRFQGEAATLALARSSHGGVREVAANVLNHVNATQPEMLHLLHARGMAMPMSDAQQRKVLKSLAALSGARFDRLYMDEVVLRYGSADIPYYERIGTITRDPTLQAWIQRQVPNLRYHAALAERALPGGAGTRLAAGGKAKGVDASAVMGASQQSGAAARPRTVSGAGTL
jgi:putative membrane protein